MSILKKDRAKEDGGRNSEMNENRSKQSTNTENKDTVNRRTDKI